MFSLYLSTYILVLIAVDRLMAVKYPLKMIKMGERTTKSLTSVYLLSGAFSVPQVSFYLIRGSEKETACVSSKCFFV